MTQKILVVNAEKCAGCRICELVCSLRHEEERNPTKSRIHVLKLKRKGAYIPVVCQQCSEPICGAVCPFNALTKNLNTGAILVDNDLCIGCKKCTNGCPYGGATVDRERSKALICDLCGGDPACVKSCPTQTLQYVAYDDSILERKNELAQGLRQILQKSAATRIAHCAKQNASELSY